MWGNGPNFNQDDAERQQRLAAAAAQVSHQLQEHQHQQQQQQQPQHPLNYNNPATAADYFNANAYQSYHHDIASNMLLEERRRMEMALAANVLQDQENLHVREAQLRRAQIRAAYERELASSLATSDQFADLRRNLLEHQLSAVPGREMNSALHQDFRNQMSSQLEHLERRSSSSIGSVTSVRDVYTAGAPSSFNAMRTEGVMDSLAFVKSTDEPSSSSPSPSSPVPNHNHIKHDPDSNTPSTNKKDTLEEQAVHTKAEVNHVTVPPSEMLSSPQESEATNQVEPMIESTPISVVPASPDKPKKKKSTPSSSNQKKANAKKTPSDKKRSKSPVPPLDTGIHPNLAFSCHNITREEYVNLEQLMEQFCKVPLLAEFSRPVSLLHPELVPLYKKVVQNPIDLGKVCRAIRKRQYTNTRQVCVDVWRIFANCVKYHTHPITREGAIPSFISIASHLREYFNALWLEYMIPSEIPKLEEKAKSDSFHTALLNAEVKRIKTRSERQNSMASVVLSSKLIEKTSDAMSKFVEAEGRVDALDKSPICENADDEVEMQAVNGVFSAIACMATRLREIAHGEYEYTAESLTTDLKRCYGDEIFEGMPSLKVKFAKRLDRMLGKLIAPVNEVSCRGINQSSVWGCMAAAIWARENTKKPYWPALVLGIMAPNDQREDWHLYLTQRNEARLPEKLQVGLQSGKKKAIQAIQRQNEGKAERMSYFLVEFLGTHEFIWVREADIIENFDPEQDVNQQLASAGNISKKKKSVIRGQTAANARMLQKATDEGRWALEEFEMLLNDPCGDQMEDFANEEEEENYTFPVLCESDDEADEADDSTPSQTTPSQTTGGTIFDTPTGIITEIDEVNELIATDGKLDYTAEGRKNAKKRAAALKKQIAEEKKSANKKKKEPKVVPEKVVPVKVLPLTPTPVKVLPAKAEKSSRQSEPDYKKEQRELEKRRKKRSRERERVLKELERKAKKMKVDGNSTMIRKGRKLGIADKRRRAESLVKGYLHSIVAKEGLRGFGSGGASNLSAANVDGSGILGVALAFRVAAGELDMPNGDDSTSSVKPWDKVDVDSSTTSHDRCVNLEKKIKLIEDAIERLARDDERRKQLLELAKQDKIKYDQEVCAAEKEARQNDMPKRKVSVKRKNSTDKEEETTMSISDSNLPSQQEIDDNTVEKEDDISLEDTSFIDDGDAGKSDASTTECAIRAEVMDAETTTGVVDIDVESKSVSDSVSEE